ncbi:hypothetical protein OH779_14570 [Actinacidiphila glaucinigra]|uniref:effector-associated constant component EACC1 n=1 Tax=Actinacidiphila glaucinigra TaxID=235986 RepID=UPI00386FB861
MLMRLRVDGEGAEDELRSLREWLLDDPDIRYYATISWDSAPPEPGEMGATEWLQLVTDNGWQVANFAVAYLAWRRTRRSGCELTIERNGITVTIKGISDTEIAEHIERSLSGE